MTDIDDGLLNLVNQSIRSIAIEAVQSEIHDPFAKRLDGELEGIRSEIKDMREQFKNDVLGVVKSSRRQIIEDRIKEFDIGSVISNLNQLPESLASQRVNVRSAKSSTDLAKQRYEAEFVAVSTAAGQQGLAGENQADRDTIADLIKDRIVNVDSYPSPLVDIVFHSTGRSKAILECRQLNTEGARKSYKDLRECEIASDEARIALLHLEDQFTALRSTIHLITSVIS